MNKLFWLLSLVILQLVVSGPEKSFSSEAPANHFLFTNDDSTSEGNSVTFYSIGNTGGLTRKKTVVARGNGIGGGFFGMNRVAALQTGKTDCVYFSDAQSGQISSVNISDLKIAGIVRGSKRDSGSSNGIGLAVGSSFLYASFADSSTIATFNVQPDCKLEFVGDQLAAGLSGGAVDGMALHAGILVVTYVDGSIESFKTGDGMPVSNGDEQYSTGSKGGSSYPSGVDITSDGHFAIFGDIATSTVIEVSDLSSGRLAKTIVYRPGKIMSSGNVLLSPDETLLYISNTQGGRVSAAYFDKKTGKLSPGCSSNILKDYGVWTYLGGLAQQKTAGTGGELYVAEFGSPSYIAVIDVQSSNGRCTLHESSKSPVLDRASSGLLSIGSYPPRRF